MKSAEYLVHESNVLGASNTVGKSVLKFTILCLIEIDYKITSPSTLSYMWQDILPYFSRKLRI